MQATPDIAFGGPASLNRIIEQGGGYGYPQSTGKRLREKFESGQMSLEELEDYDRFIAAREGPAAGTVADCSAAKHLHSPEKERAAPIPEEMSSSQ